MNAYLFCLLMTVVNFFFVLKAVHAQPIQFIEDKKQYQAIMASEKENHEREIAEIKAQYEEMIGEHQKRNAEQSRFLLGAAALCFPASTPVIVKSDDSGSYHSLPIESIRAGDSVFSCNLDLKDGVCEIRKVLNVFQSTADRLVRISFNGRILRSTENHPFYVTGKKDWVEARYLKAGDQLQAVTGESATIENIEREEGEFTVYNLMLPS